MQSRRFFVFERDRKVESWGPEADDARLELRVRLLAVPIALAVARLLCSFNFGRRITRIFVAMWVHETGHAMTAWLCGFLALPGPWLTPMSTERSPLFGLLLTLAIVAVAWQTWQRGQRLAMFGWLSVLLIHLICALGLSADQARQLIIFFGDGGSLLLGTVLILCIYARPGSALHNGWLRYGCLAIGAGAFMDAFEQWWASRSDLDRIPFGMNEGVGLSDPSVLSETYGWSTGLLIHRYVTLGCGCLVVLAAVYAWQLWEAKRAGSQRGSAASSNA